MSPCLQHRRILLAVAVEIKNKKNFSLNREKAEVMVTSKKLFLSNYKAQKNTTYLTGASS